MIPCEFVPGALVVNRHSGLVARVPLAGPAFNVAHNGKKDSGGTHVALEHPLKGYAHYIWKISNLDLAEDEP